ncbi:MAG: hypothetical protein IJS44_04435 [Clostridia bacterium]|nr:hypothetical protein [Clostridia bacterium]
MLLLLLLYVGLFLYGLPALGTVLRRMQALLSDIELLHFDILLKCGGVLMICAVATTVAACVGKKEIGEILDFIALLEVLLLCRPLFEDLIFAAREILG